MTDIDRTMTGKVSDKAIWQLQANIYQKHVTEPLQRQGIKAPTVTPRIVVNTFLDIASTRNV